MADRYWGPDLVALSAEQAEKLDDLVGAAVNAAPAVGPRCGYVAEERFAIAKYVDELLAAGAVALQTEPADSGYVGPMGPVRIYVASKTKHAPLWRTMRAEGAPIVCSWIDEAGAGETRDWAELWRRIRTEIAGATALIVYCEPDEALKGAYVEMGIALAVRIPIWWVGPHSLNPLRQDGVRFADSVADAVRAATAELDVHHV